MVNSFHCQQVKCGHFLHLGTKCGIKSLPVRQIIPLATANVPSNQCKSVIQASSDWSIAESAKLYNFDGWGSPYFFVNSSGNVAVQTSGLTVGEGIDLLQVVQCLKEDGISTPIVIRFPQIIQNRIRELSQCFSVAIAKYNYKNKFQGVFPVKCNQDRWLIEDIVEYGKKYDFGLETGSKAELIITMAKLPRGSSNALLICNGYKDRTYIQCALLARKLGLNSVIVLEQVEELVLVLEASRNMGVEPVLGLRAKLSTKHEGHWGSTSGDGSKFGLTPLEMVSVVDILSKEGMLPCLQLLHFHVGSQIASISHVKETMREASNLFCELVQMGAPMAYFDVGGGLAVDYDGSKSDSVSSANYSIQNYANDIVASLQDACLLKQVAEPLIVSESGRALASHHSVFVFDVLSSNNPSQLPPSVSLEAMANEVLPGGITDPEQSFDVAVYFLRTLLQVCLTVDEGNIQESYNDAVQFRAEAAAMFKMGCMSLRQRAFADALCQETCAKAVSLLTGKQGSHGSVPNLPKTTYHANFSVFRSVPDTWAISQLFPMAPIHRLEEEPTENVYFADLTCDSDGLIDRFISPEAGLVSDSLRVHKLREGEKYYVGLFLGGVYQEVMGSFHNLFGMTNVVRVVGEEVGDSPGTVRWHVERYIDAQSVEEVLSTVHYSSLDLVNEVYEAARKAGRNGTLSQEDIADLIKVYSTTLKSTTYLET